VSSACAAEDIQRMGARGIVLAAGVSGEAADVPFLMDYPARSFCAIIRHALPFRLTTTTKSCMNLSSPMPKNPEAFPVMLYVPGGFWCRFPSSGEIRKGQNARFSRIRFDCFYPSREKLFLFIAPQVAKSFFYA